MDTDFTCTICLNTTTPRAPDSGWRCMWLEANGERFWRLVCGQCRARLGYSRYSLNELVRMFGLT